MSLATESTNRSILVISLVCELGRCAVDRVRSQSVSAIESDPLLGAQNALVVPWSADRSLAVKV